MTDWRDVVGRLREIADHMKQDHAIFAPGSLLSAAALIERQAGEIERLREACNIALGHLTTGMDGDWKDCDPAEMLRAALAATEDGE